MTDTHPFELTEQYGAPSHTILHLSDTHFVEDRRPLYGRIDSDARLAAFLERLQGSAVRPDVIVLTGDLADRGSTDAYARLRTMLEPVAKAYACQLVWVMGNHDHRESFREKLLDDSSGMRSPIDQVIDVNGLRVVALDSTVPGYHHGELDDSQLSWLARVLEDPAPYGTLLALHHPPVPTALPLLQLVELREADRLAPVIEHTDVRGILAGHFHYPTHSLIAGIPVSVAAATCYTQDLLVANGHTRGQAGAQGANIVHVYSDRVVHSSVSTDVFDSVYEVTPADMQALLSNSPAQPDLWTADVRANSCPSAGSRSQRATLAG
jgi:Icc protein